MNGTFYHRSEALGRLQASVCGVGVLEAYLDSVFQRGSQALEVIVVDNGSSDGTRDLLRRLEESVSE
jgi:cellulose synthase/poly-beta-1,6-N-acetylglucosamine synthase-like glycosyltransferase